MDLAQTVESVGGSSTLLGALMSGALLIAATGIYRFIVNLRTTERGINRKRMRDANRGERQAQYEAALWQAYAADLEWSLRRRGFASPVMSKELAELVKAAAEEDATASTDNDPVDESTGGRPAP